MTTSFSQVAAATTYTQGSSAIKTLVNDMYDILDQDEQIELDLSNATLVSVLSAYQEYMRISSPKYTIQRVIGMIEDLESTIGRSIMPSKITSIFNAKLYQFALNTGKKGRRDASTVNGYMCKITAALSWASMYGCKVSRTYKLYQKRHSEHTKVALTNSQISHIYNFQIEKNKDEIKELLKLDDMKINRFSWTNLYKVRDQFVLDCQIAQRYSDAHRISASNFTDSNTTLKVTQQKTANRAVVNMLEYAMDKKICIEILNKYGFEAPCKNIRTSLFNKYLHLLLRAIGDEFNVPILSENKRNGDIDIDTRPMWMAITSHTARRSFITYHVVKGTNLIDIQRCSGHSDIRSLQKYVC